jgi:hypothetical protein
MAWTTRQLNEVQSAFVRDYMDDMEDHVLGVRIARHAADGPTIVVTVASGSERAPESLPRSFEGLPVRARVAQPMVLAHALTR